MQKTSKKLEVGDIVVVNLNPTIGDEKQKKRPCVVIEAGYPLLDLIIALPITENNGKRSKYFFVPIPSTDNIKLSKPSVVDCYQIRTLSLERLEKKKEGYIIYGRLTEKTLDEIRSRLAMILDISEKHLNLL